MENDIKTNLLHFAPFVSLLTAALIGCGSITEQPKTEDTTAPTVPSLTVSKTSVASDEAFTITASGSTDNIGIAQIVLALENSKGARATLTNAPYQFSDKLTCPESVGDYPYKYKAQAVDAAGNASAFSEPVTVTLRCPQVAPADTTPPEKPVLTLSQRGAEAVGVAKGGTAPKTPSITVANQEVFDAAVSATDNIGVARVELRLQNVTAPRQNSSTAPFSMSDAQTCSDTISAPFDETFTYVAYAFDAVGNISPASDPFIVYVRCGDTTPPSTPIMQLNKTVFQTGELLTATVTASDNAGVSVVQLRLVREGGQLLLQEDTAAPFELNETVVCTGTGASEPKTFIAWAYDAAGNVSTSEPQTITINCLRKK
jgi:Bacterial Ig-like domain